MENKDQKQYDRKQFIRDTIKMTAGIALWSSSSAAYGISAAGGRKEYTVQDVIDIILQSYPGERFKDTVDTIKSGTATATVTGIVTTMFPTVEVITKAIEQKANLIIAHEPAFFNGSDNKEWIKDNRLVALKTDLLNNNNITIWRFHDYCHAIKPDMISYGFAKKAGWLPYFKPGELMLNIPSMRLSDLAKHLKKKLGIHMLRIIGDPSMSCQTIALLPGAWGGQRQMTTVNENQPDVLVVGEATEWETVEYIRDTKALGLHTSLIVLGHSVSEEPGMEWTADWLKGKLDGVPVSHIPSGDPFTWIF